MKKPWKLFIFILVLAAGAVFVDWPGLPIHLQLGSYKINADLPPSKVDYTLLGNRIRRDLDIKQGLDIAGGSHITLQVDMSKVNSADQQQALDSDTEVIRRRVNLFGTNEPVIQSSKAGSDYRIIVDLPGLKDVNQAV